ncbi:hypothetical protein BCT30_06415 [Enterovibrio norvegicus]|uniref:DUF945 family protein n=1 Tax=Enterovibrio norvegicus TaxID=188144 RepID=UPI000C817C13|nr:DUF945 family protein [Enterovibrio norvegicus]MCC4797310.1 YdgA family protein [Enterovibrio norvegicus]PMH72298.1 hypothetical protein BCU62_23545 [Enterovibrio norvegicus]PMI27035.1 hypothetical protein BCU47_03550 [Enterovibrio norvegicus]PMN56087.1 hypothetical protein BCT30_06415 [Enterovibrio norvegicus]TKF15405.1 DUF945 domain-containing protein [Enterovibrio norvegicus]
MIFGKYAAIGGAVALVVLWPLASGHVGQSIYDREVEQSQSPYAVITSESYDRGYLSSDVVTKVSLVGSTKEQLELDGIPTSYVLNSKVSHGFFSISTDSVLEMTPELKVLTDKLWPNGESPFTFHSETGISGKTDYTLSMAAIDANEEGLKITSTPFVVDGSMDKAGVISFTMNMDSFGFESEYGENAKVTNMTGSGQGELIDDIWVGSQKVNFGRFDIDNQDGLPATLTNLSIEVKNLLSSASGGDVKSADAEDLRFNNENLISLEKFAVKDELTLNNLKLGMNFDALDYTAMTTLATVADAMGEEPSPEEMEEMIKALDSLVEKGLSAKLNPLEVDTPEGQIDANLDLQVASGLTSVSQNFQALPSKISGELNLSAPAAYVNGVPELSNMAENLEQYGFVSQSENMVKLNAKIEGDQLVSPTGQKIPVGLLMMLMM